MKTSLNANFVQKTDKPGRYFDGRTGLHLLIKKTTKKYWIYRYMRSGRRQDMSLGVFPWVTLAEARKKAMEASFDLARGINPIEARKKLKAAAIKASEDQIKFRDFAKNCIELKSHEWRNSKHGDQWSYTIEEYANPIIGDRPLNQITTEDILKVLQPIWLTKHHTASRLRGRIEWILASATTRKLREGVNPAQWRSHLDTILPKVNKSGQTKHFKALHFSQVPNFIQKLRDRDGVASIALEFTILNCARTGEVIGATRDEVAEGIWVIPGERMKAGKEHRVPLSNRAKELIEIARYLDPNSNYLFSIDGKKLSNMAMYSVLKRMGLNATVHGFRSTFRDWVAETTDHPSEVAEKALAHQISNQSEAAYRRGDLMAKRLNLMADWEDYCNQGAISNILTLKVA
ncbi:integrase arm-type DNA-binding domain-containing protein [Polynucleobacter sp. MG-Unter2-18]|uniref:tyrosine-type recombinase/integrase n=1 Tax=Polynucleobacter sp. MG-Unter2-18 TaxID=2081052 RepID=UPI001BFEE4D7|nr:integrase arm-type DNA-binding domain-containing protein [Polynucleobacter sp. MG-Unter2-18]QWD95242.1 integrase arm-type DNA-binding domain-containing protein [Polynucleobacter sp. MG-Unter2-18]